MNNHFGLSFTPEHICYAYFVEGGDKPALERVGKLSYAVPYREDVFFSEQNNLNVSELLKGVFQDVQGDQSRISVSIESNLGLLKRVAFPLNLDEDGKKEHIHWDLTESVTLPISEYAYFRSANCYTFKNFEEELVIAVPKQVINFFRKLAGTLSVELSNIIIHQLAAELLVQNALDAQLEKLVILQKISGERIESTFLWNGIYYSSHYDMLPSPFEIVSFIELVRSKIGYIENLFEQYGETNIMVDRILLYGDDLQDDIIQKIQKNMSIPVDRINVTQNLALSQNMQNTPLSDQEFSSYVECIGVTLDV